MASRSSAHTWFFCFCSPPNLLTELRDPTANQYQKASFFCLTAFFIFHVHWCVLGLLPWQASTTSFQPQFKAAISAIEALNPLWLHFPMIPWDKGIAPLKVGVKELWQDSLLKVPVHPHDLFGFPISPFFTWASKTNSYRSKDMTMKSFANLEPKVALDQIHLRTTICLNMVFVMANAIQWNTTRVWSGKLLFLVTFLQIPLLS